jgi:ferredoxin
MAKYRVLLSREECIGCGMCESVCPKTFVIGPDGKSKLKCEEIDEKEFAEAKAAETGCPAEVIKIEKYSE